MTTWQSYAHLPIMTMTIMTLLAISQVPQKLGLSLTYKISRTFRSIKNKRICLTRRYNLATSRSSIVAQTFRACSSIMWHCLTALRITYILDWFCSHFIFFCVQKYQVTYSTCFCWCILGALLLRWLLSVSFVSTVPIWLCLIV